MGVNRTALAARAGMGSFERSSHGRQAHGAARDGQLADVHGGVADEDLRERVPDGGEDVAILGSGNGVSRRARVVERFRGAGDARLGVAKDVERGLLKVVAWAPRPCIRGGQPRCRTATSRWRGELHRRGAHGTLQAAS
jgi:hypothetical protein